MLTSYRLVMEKNSTLRAPIFGKTFALFLEIHFAIFDYPQRAIPATQICDNTLIWHVPGHLFCVMLLRARVNGRNAWWSGCPHHKTI